MRLISLNIWGGEIYNPLMKFIKDQAKKTDIYCFQETFQSDSSVKTSSDIRTNIFNDINSVLKDFNGYFAKTFSRYDLTKIVNFDLRFGIAIFVKKSISVDLYEEEFIHKVEGGYVDRKNYSETSRKIQSIQFKKANKIFNIYNLHGLWAPDALGGKEDNEERIRQSEEIKNFTKRHKGEKIITGDFNLYPNTKSLTMLEDSFKNLIKEYDISTTRSALYTRKFKFADYTLVTSRVKVIDFKVPNIVVSDHLPMILEFT